MSNLDNLLNKAVGVANDAGKKANDVLEASKLKIQSAGVQNDIQKQFETLGMLVYQSNKNGENKAELIQQCITQIDSMRLQLDRLDDKIDGIKQLKKCSNCMGANPADGIFCQRCGAKLD